MSGVCPCWVTHNWLSPIHVPMPSTTAKTAGLPSVHWRHRAWVAASLVGSNWVMIGLMVRPLMPPAWLICFTKSLIDVICSLYSLSCEKPSRPARLLMATTGKTTLMLDAVTPRLLVLAELGGEAPVDLDDAASAAPADPAPPGLPEGAKATQATRPTTTATTMRTVRTCTAAGRRRKRRQDRPSGARGFRARRRVVLPLRVPMLILLRRGRPHRAPPGDRRRRGRSDRMPSRPRRSHQGRRPAPSGQRGPPRAVPRPPPTPAP